MGSINYDPDGTPNVDPESFIIGESLGLAPVHVICDEESATGCPVDFIAFVKFVPRIGERIELEDGNACQVKRVYYKTVRVPEGIITMVPNVYAIRINKD